MNKNPDVINFYELDEMKPFLIKADNPNYDYHHLTIPMMAVLIGPTGSGKTNAVCSIIKAFSDKSKNRKKRGTFASIQYFTQNSNEPLLNYLKSKSNQISIFEGLEKLKIDDLDNEQNHLIVFDDMVTKPNQLPMLEAFSRARKQGCSLIYISQSMFATPIFIRKNCHYLWILKLSGKREIDLVMREYSLGLSADVLRRIYEYATNEKFCYLMIDNTTPDMTRRFRKGFLEFLKIEDFS